jgi:hypothetical protein
VCEKRFEECGKMEKKEILLFSKYNNDIFLKNARQKRSETLIS